MSVHGRNVMMIGGAMASTASLEFANDYADVTRFGSPARGRIATVQSATLTVSLVDMRSEAHCVLHGLLGKGTLVFLGDGWMCKACGDYNPAGTILCAKCGGPSKIVPFIAPDRFPFIMTQLWSEWLHDDINVTSMEFVSTGAVTQRVVDRLFHRRKLALTATHSGVVYRPGFFLCKFCGLAVRNGSTCPGCGGKRFPWQELASLERSCVYCGRRVRGGVVCEGCGAAIRGTLLKEVLV